jgi:hypothetical protein
MNKPGQKRADYWRQIVNEHERSGLAVRQFCLQAHINEHTFYNQRKRLRDKAASAVDPVRFALVEPTRERPSEALELTLATGERLRIGAGADAGTLRMVLAALRG